MSIEVKVRELEGLECPTDHFIMEDYEAIKYYEVDKEVLIKARAHRAGGESIFTVDGKKLYGGDHHEIQGFEVINGEPLLKAVHKNSVTPLGNFYRRDGKIAFGGYNYLAGQGISNSINVYGTICFFITDRMPHIYLPTPQKIGASYFSLQGKRYLSVEEIISEQSVMVKLSKMGLFDEGKRVYDLLDNFLISCGANRKSRYSVMETLNRSMEKIINDNTKNKEVQQLAVSEALSSLRNMLEKHPGKFLEGLGVMQG